MDSVNISIINEIDNVAVNVIEQSENISVSVIDEVQNITITTISPVSAVPDNGTTGQVLQKLSATPFDTAWISLTPSYEHSFLTSDWVGPSAGLYCILINHNLNSLIVRVEVWNTLDVPVDTERLITSKDSTTLRVPHDPDLRFSGRVFITKI